MPGKIQRPSTRLKRGEGAAISKADRMTAWRQQVKREGGKEVRAYFGRRAWEALQRLAPEGERGPLLERLVLEAARTPKGTAR